MVWRAGAARVNDPFQPFETTKLILLFPSVGLLYLGLCTVCACQDRVKTVKRT